MTHNSKFMQYAGLVLVILGVAGCKIPNLPLASENKIVPAITMLPMTVPMWRM